MELLIERIEKGFNEKKVLKGGSFTFEKGKIYGLLGRNGAGKTTLFNCISGEMEYDGGSVKLVDDGKEYPLEYEQIGYAFSTPILPEFLTGYEFIKFFTDINKKRIDNLKSVEEYADMVCLARDDLDRLIKGYSHGMKNKLQMLCMLISKPPVILLDEPLTSLDVVAAHEMKELLKSMKKDHIIIFSTHILQLARDLCDDIVLLHKGILEGVDEATYHSKDFEDKLMVMLSEDDGSDNEAVFDNADRYNDTVSGDSSEQYNNTVSNENISGENEEETADIDPYEF